MRDWIVIGASAFAAAIIVKAARDAGQLDAILNADPEDQTGSFIDQLPDLEDMKNLLQPTNTSADQAQSNLAAMLYAIRKCEGTATDEGYQALFGWRPGNGKTFDDFSAHPQQFFLYTDKAGKTIRTSAAGAYQITYTTYRGLVNGYNEFQSGDFSPASQDAMAVKLISQRGALADVMAGRFDTALRKLRPVWASLPGAGVNQPERSIDYVTQAYIQAGGQLA
jgi:muramidase (phage lysozyme)